MIDHSTITTPREDIRLPVHIVSTELAPFSPLEILGELLRRLMVWIQREISVRVEVARADARIATYNAGRPLADAIGTHKSTVEG